MAEGENVSFFNTIYDPEHPAYTQEWHVMARGANEGSLKKLQTDIAKHRKNCKFTLTKKGELLRDGKHFGYLADWLL
jgi:hypothetical protein